MSRSRIICFLIVCTLVVPRPAAAGVSVFTNRALWLAALGGPPNFSQDFNSFTADANFDVTPFDAGAFTLQVSGAESAFSFLDVPPLSNTDPTVDGTSYVMVFVDGITPPFTTIRLDFKTTAFGFGGDFSYAGNSSELALDLTSASGTTTVHVPGPGTAHTFFGFVSTEPVSTILFHNSVNDGFFLDNVAARVTGATAARSVSWGRLKALYR